MGGPGGYPHRLLMVNLESSVPTRSGRRGGGCIVAGRSAQPLLPGPSLPPSPRPGLSPLLFPFFASLPPLPPDTQNEAPSPQNPTNFPRPRASHLSGARRNCRPGGSSGRPPSSLLAFASLTGEGRPEEGEARSRGGRGSGRSARSCFPAFRRERRKKGARQGSARAAAALSTAPLRPGLARRQRLLPSRRLLPRRPASPAQFLIQPLPLTPRRRDTGSRRRHGSPPRSPCARASPLPRHRLPGGLEKERGPRARPRLADPGKCEGRAKAGRRGKAARRRIPMGFFPGPAPSALPAEGVKRRRTTSVPAWSGLLSAARPGRRLLCSLCGSRGLSQVGFSGHAGRHLGQGGEGVEGGGDRLAGAAELQVHALGYRYGVMSSVSRIGNWFTHLFFF